MPEHAIEQAARIIRASLDHHPATETDVAAEYAARDLAATGLLHTDPASEQEPTFLDGYRFALTNLHQPGVLADARRYVEEKSSSAQRVPQPGDRVRVTYDATYVEDWNDGHNVTAIGSGWDLQAPPGSTVEVIEPAPAAEQSSAVPYSEHEAAVLDVIRERDHATEWADRLAAALAPAHVRGEHSSGNDPWRNALEWAEGKEAAADLRPADTGKETDRGQ